MNLGMNDPVLQQHMSLLIGLDRKGAYHTYQSRLHPVSYSLMGLRATIYGNIQRRMNATEVCLRRFLYGSI